MGRLTGTVFRHDANNNGRVYSTTTRLLMTPRRTNPKPTTIVLSQKSALRKLPLPLTLPILTYPRLAFHQRSLPVYIQLLPPVMLPVNSPQSHYPHFHLRNHRMICHQKNLPQLYILDQENVPVEISQVFQIFLTWHSNREIYLSSRF